MFGWSGLRAVFPAVAACGLAFAGTQFVVSNFINPQLTDILSSLAAMASLVVYIRIKGSGHGTEPIPHPKRTPGEVFNAWVPYLLLVVFVLAWGFKPFQSQLDRVTFAFHWPGLAVPAIYKFNWLSASGTACLFAAILSAPRGGHEARFVFRSGKAHLEATGAGGVDARRHSGAGVPDEPLRGHRHSGPGLRCHRGALPFASAMLGWLGVFLTGSDTSANALFGNLQVVTANKLGMNPVLMAASNSAGGVMGKMISLTSIAVAACATSMRPEDEAPAVPHDFETQRPPGIANRSDRSLLRLRDAGLGAVDSVAPAIWLPACSLLPIAQPPSVARRCRECYLGPVRSFARP